MHRSPVTIAGLIARLQRYPEDALCPGTFWLADDFLSLAPSLTDEDIEAVMEIADGQHDAEVGFNRDTLGMAIERMREE